MKSKSSVALFALIAGLSPLAASAGDVVEVKALAEISGLSQRQVSMLLHARTPHAESRYAFERIEEKFVRAVGEEQYRDMLAGKPVRFEREVDGRKVAYVVRLRSRG